jgi:hypothetical protein
MDEHNTVYDGESGKFVKPKPESWLDSFTSSKIALFIVLAILFVVGVFVVFGLFAPEQVKSDARFCVEWQGNIKIESLAVACYNWQTDRLMCAWGVRNDSSLEVVGRNSSTLAFFNSSNVYPCVKYVEVKEVKS